MSDIVWEAPPSEGGNKGKGRNQRFVAELKKRPGEWARYPSNFTHNATAGQMNMRFRDCRFVGRKVDDGEWGVWGKYVGDGAQ